MTDPVWELITEADRAFLTAMARELLASRSKYPGSQNRHVAFTGEAGEAMEAYAHTIQGKTTVDHLGLELLQAATMACRLAVEGDRSLAQGLQNLFPAVLPPPMKDVPPWSPVCPVLVK